MEKNRIVVTGMGALTPLGGGVQSSWDNLLLGKSGISVIQHFDTSDIRSKIGGIVPGPSGAEAEKIESVGAGELPFGSLDYFNPNQWISAKDQSKIDRFIVLGVVAARQALRDAQWAPQTEADRALTGVSVGSGIGGLSKITENAQKLQEKGARSVSPYFVPSSLINLVSGHIAIEHGLRGPNFSVVSACAAGAHSIGEACHMIQRGDAKVMVAGGAEGAVCPLAMAGFASMRALSTRNDAPEKASRPWDKERDGFVIGEGAGVLVLEELEHAQRRGATIYGEIVGYGASGDASHITAPDQEGRGAVLAMERALAKAGLQAEQVGYINAHGTSTPQGDAVELRAIQKVFTHPVQVSSTKSSIGHLLGASGSVEAIFCLKALAEGRIAGTLNYESYEKEEELRNVEILGPGLHTLNTEYVLSNSFGFGGTNCSLIFKKYTA